MNVDILFAICIAAMAGIVIGQLGKFGNFVFGVLLALAVILLFL